MQVTSPDYQILNQFARNQKMHILQQIRKCIFKRNTKLKYCKSDVEKCNGVSIVFCECVCTHSQNSALAVAKITVCQSRYSNIYRLLLRFCSVARRPPASEEGGMVARFQPPTKVVLAQFQIFLATPGTFLSTFWGSFELSQCTGARDLLLTSGTD